MTRSTDWLASFFREFTLRGHRPAENVPELRDKVQELVIQGRRSFLLDCSRVIAIDSQGIGGLVRNWVSLQSQGAKLKLLNPSVRMREVLEIVGLQKVIGSFDGIEKALRNF